MVFYCILIESIWKLGKMTYWNEITCDNFVVMSFLDWYYTFLEMTINAPHTNNLICPNWFISPICQSLELTMKNVWLNLRSKSLAFSIANIPARDIAFMFYKKKTYAISVIRVALFPWDKVIEVLRPKPYRQSVG